MMNIVLLDMLNSNFIQYCINKIQDDRENKTTSCKVYSSTPSNISIILFSYKHSL